MDPSAARENFLWIKLPTTITRRNTRKFQPSFPLLPRFQCNQFFNSSCLHAQHMLILIIPKISHSFCFLIPWIPHHCMNTTDILGPTKLRYIQCKVTISNKQKTPNAALWLKSYVPFLPRHHLPTSNLL